MKKSISAIVLALLASHSVTQSFATPPYGDYEITVLPVADATISSNAPDSNFGGAATLGAGLNAAGSMLSRSLIRFDLSSLPTNAFVSNVTVTVVSAGPAPASSDVYLLSPLLESWVEDQVTWNDRATGSPWSAGGGQDGTDFALDYLGYGFGYFGAGVTNTFSAFEGTNGFAADVQNWIHNPGQNFGWMLTAENEDDAGNAIQIYSRETTGYAPVLDIVYTIPFQPPILQVLPVTDGNFNFSFNTDPFHGYLVQVNSDLSKANWSTWVILDPCGPGCMPSRAQFSDKLTSTNRFYRVIAD